jgi:hypothetical protein
MAAPDVFGDADVATEVRIAWPVQIVSRSDALNAGEYN